MVRDILKIEHEPLNEVLKVDSLKPDNSGDENKKSDNYSPTTVNTNFTKSGRPINNNLHVRWKQMNLGSKTLVDNPAGEQAEMSSEAKRKLHDPATAKSRTEKDKSKEELPELSDVNVRRPVVPQFKLAGSSLTGGKSANFMDEGRPIPTELECEDPVRIYPFLHGKRFSLARSKR